MKIALRCYFLPSKLTKFYDLELAARTFSCVLSGSMYWGKLFRR